MYGVPMESYRAFVSKLPDDVTPIEGEKKYNEYKEEYMKRMYMNFFKERKEDEWFKEKYHPKYLEKNFERQLARAKQQAESFKREVEEGSADLAPLDADKYVAYLKEKHPEQIYKSASSTEENGEPKEGKEEKKEMEEGEDTNVDKNEPAVNTQMICYNPSPPHTLFIKSVHTNCSKEDMFRFLNSVEGAPVVSLSLSDPRSLKGWSRLGW